MCVPAGARARLIEVRPRRPEQYFPFLSPPMRARVSMKSGLEGRNNPPTDASQGTRKQFVSMKSGLEGRNNDPDQPGHRLAGSVSMKSGLEGRNNRATARGAFVMPF